MSMFPAGQPVAQSRDADDRDAQDQHPTPQQPIPKPSIIDGYVDVLEVLNPKRRRGLVAQIAVGFYEGWRPGRTEVADIVAVELGMLTVDECVRRRRLRNDGYQIPEIDVISALPGLASRPARRFRPQTPSRDHLGQWITQNTPVSLSWAGATHHEGQADVINRDTRVRAE